MLLFDEGKYCQCNAPFKISSFQLELSKSFLRFPLNPRSTVEGICLWGDGLKDFGGTQKLAAVIKLI